MSKREAVTLTDEQVAAINKILSHGERVELFRVKDGIRMIKIMRRDIKLYAEGSEPSNGV